jgi:hypothetical protein
VAVKATFPLARRVCPASGGSNYFDGIWSDESSPWPNGPKVPTGSVRPPHDHHRRPYIDKAMGAFAAWSRVRRHRRPAAYARKVLRNRHRSLLRRGR